MYRKITIVVFSVLFLLTNVLSTFANAGIGQIGQSQAFSVPTAQKQMFVIGDSYANCFRDFEGTVKYDFDFFYQGGLNNKDNQAKFLTAILGNDLPFIFFITGVNDIANNIDPNFFKSYVDLMAKTAKEKGKVMFLMSYMDFPLSKDFDYIFKIDDYDNALKEVAKNNANVVFIDMKQYEKKEFAQGDNVHYNKVFYDALEAKIQLAIQVINNIRARY